MSAATTQAIFSALTGNANLVALLSPQRDGSGNLILDGNGNRKPCIYYARMSEIAPPWTLPNLDPDDPRSCLTFRECTVDQAPGFWPDFNNDRQFYDVEIWTNKRGSMVIDTIRAEVDRSIHRKSLVLPDPLYNYCFWFRRVNGAAPGNFDRTLQAWFGMFRYAGWVASQ